MNNPNLSLQELASRYVNSTNANIFLTGKAGTGKTTFLKQIVNTTHKNVVIAAPTGIAAINAGGVTLHSLFQLPFGAFIPENLVFSEDISFQVNTPKTLLANIQMNRYKRKLLQNMELLVIDEVSMMRADILDAINTILKSVRRNQMDFGGVQMLFIGDLLQLPPIVKDDEWALLSRYYQGMYFFNSKVLQNKPPVYIELDKIYRQSDAEFIAVLNHLRDNVISDADIEILNKHYKPGFNPKADDGYIYLTTHNYQADSVNSKELEKLPGKLFNFDAKVEGEFSEYNYPVEFTLRLKKGAQVMFIKNDYSGEQLYFNGKIGYVSHIDAKSIEVSFNDGTPSTVVEPYVWENKRFTVNKDTGEIEEKLVGKFIHFPIKPAWAITIHKSQGLTFEKAIIDVSKAFAPGQAYVALSRLKSLNGLVLTGEVPRDGLNQNSLIYNFANIKSTKKELVENIDKFSLQYVYDYALQAYDFRNVTDKVRFHLLSYNKEEGRSVKQKHKSLAENTLNTLLKEKQVADKFLLQIRSIISKADDDALEQLTERVKAANGYFIPRLSELQKLIDKKINELESIKGTKKYITELQELELLFFDQLKQMNKTLALAKKLIENSELSKDDIKNDNIIKERIGKNTKAKTKTKKTKIDTKKISFDLYKNGKTIKEIAKERELVETTIEGHLAHFIEKGDADIYDFASQKDIDWVFEIADELETTSLSAIKEVVLDDLSYSQIKMIVAHYKAVRGVVTEEKKAK